MGPDETGRGCKCGATDATFLWNCSEMKRFWDKLMRYLNSVFSLHLVKPLRSRLLLDFSDWDLGSHPKSITPLLVNTVSSLTGLFVLPLSCMKHELKYYQLSIMNVKKHFLRLKREQ